jgi:parvulin-like peptidyl-prolyl isomerase
MGCTTARLFTGLGFALMLCAGCGGNNEHVVAVVNDTEVTDEQFRERYQKYLSGSSNKDNIQVRKQVLENMINEVLIAEDLRTSGADDDSAFRKGMDLIRQQAMADGYARRLTTDTMTVTRRQLEEEFRRYNTRVAARYVYAPSEEGTRALRQRLMKGETFESLARETFEDPGLANNGGSLGTFGWGEMEEALEEAAYTLPLGQLSEPVKLAIGFAILRVDARTVINPLASESDYAKVKGKLTEAIVKRTAPRLLGEHVRAIAASMDPQFDEATLGDLMAAWQTLTGEEKTLHQPESTGRSPQDLRGRTVARLRGSWWTVETLLRKLEDTKERQRRRVKSTADLKEVILGLAAREEMLERAGDLHLEREPQVASQMENLGGEFRLRYWAGLVQDTVGRYGWPDTLLRRFYEEHKAKHTDPPMVNVAEVLVRTEQEAIRIAREARQGADFGALARAHSIRLWAAKRGGELGFNTMTGFGVMGEKFFAARVGEIIGPAKVDPYWGVFKVLEQEGGRIKSFEESRDLVLKEVSETNKQEAFLAALGRLREKANVTTYIERLANIVVQSENK